MPVLLQEVRAGDLRRRHAHQRAGMALHQLGVACVGRGGVQHRQQMALRVQDRRAAAGQRQVPLQVVFAAVHAQRTALHRTGADAVGALVAFGPTGATEQPGLAERTQQRRILHAVQDRGLGVGEHHRVAAAGDLFVEIFHLHLGDAQQRLQPLLALAQLTVVMDHRRGVGVRGQAVLVEAAPPRACQRRRQGLDLAEMAHARQRRAVGLGGGWCDDLGLREAGDSRLGHGRALVPPRGPCASDAQTRPGLNPQCSKAMASPAVDPPVALGSSLHHDCRWACRTRRAPAAPCRSASASTVACGNGDGANRIECRTAPPATQTARCALPHAPGRSRVMPVPGRCGSVRPARAPIPAVA
ncbi:hypothetical protein NB706_002834 [Xanthomonas sacchari]|nr:hypothetical protein [Xanthomonas sacchari]